MMDTEKLEPSDTPEAPPEAEQPAVEASLEEQLARAREDAQKYLGNWQRAEADFQNYKKRIEQERDENRRFASAALVMNILPILDDLERALMSVDAHLAGLTWLDGVRLIYRKLQLILENAGVSAIEVEGQQFDPRYHEAVMHADGEEGKILAEVQRGYMLHDRVLRPAMVVVGKGEKGSGQGTVDSGQTEEGSGKQEEGGEAKDDV
ncbi:MAG: nucleotide exchange factor GrpE [Dehalococcoidia bacterium]|nr:nucleotide exchange factor GrpE [Dehalococcoidia bacterium]